MQKKHVEYAVPKGAPAGVIVPGVLVGSSVYRQTLTVSNNAITTLTLNALTGLIRITALTNGVFLKYGSGVDKAAWAKATAVFTASDVITDGETATVGSKVYTFVDALSEDPTVENEVLIGDTVADTLDNFKLALIS